MCVILSFIECNWNQNINMSFNRNKNTIASRFRGLLPVVVDVETSGLNPATDALLEIAAITLKLDADGKLGLDKTHAFHIEPFTGARIDPEALRITGIDPGYPLRLAIPEKQALHVIFSKIRQLVVQEKCQRAVLVGHNAWFDLAFVQAGAQRSGLKSNPFHSFTTFDTATLAAVALGETVLAKAARAIKLPFDVNQAHSAIYDAKRTAELFCHIVNYFKVQIGF
jgi:ribonuclease T